MPDKIKSKPPVKKDKKNDVKEQSPSKPSKKQLKLSKK
jgi:hypothetical protein